MKLRELGEDRLVAGLTRGLPLGPQVRVGPGDDCAVIGGQRDRWWTLLKTDAVVEGVHFLPQESLRLVGWKALCRAISDVAAMGGVPQEALVSVALSPETEYTAAQELYAGLKKAATRFGVSLVGGETSRSPGPLFVSVALTGRVERARCILRSGGKPGDGVYATGRLGGSLAGKHLRFTPRLAEARWLTEHFSLHAMMDLSDGLGADLPRLLRASGCGVALEMQRIPRTPGCTIQQALSDGEDFELLFTLAEKEEVELERAWRTEFPRLPLTRIGRLAAKSRRSLQTHGFDHFA